ncbi:GyrI-like domain-containing protein [Plantactinospora sp. S1510]|uniref:GyrI-like domain-containing protein n=1 Tax=Plantactinospora alkalitolerans TaxID=2789879 RepID=A0ABS0GZ64_9ACTN|nr:GyrI-like domain-containing protein [Plantactinospora alkalitolerans]
MPKTDFKKVHKNLYAAGAAPALVDVPELAFLAIDGVGDPDGPVYREAVEALYGVSYGVRFGLKRAGVLEYPVMPLEGLWWGAGERQDLPALDRSTWHWTMLVLQPPQVDAALVAETVAATARKRPSGSLERIELRRVAEGPSAQVLHVGPYHDEPATRDRLMAFVDESGYRISGKHHEIYLSNPTRTAAEKLKTILRYAVVSAAAD